MPRRQPELYVHSNSVWGGRSFEWAVVVGIPMRAPVMHVADTPITSGQPCFAGGQVTGDSRLGPLKDLNGYFPFTVPTSREQWQDRAEQVRRQIQVATGLWPMPEKTPLNAVVLWCR